MPVPSAAANPPPLAPQQTDSFAMSGRSAQRLASRTRKWPAVWPRGSTLSGAIEQQESRTYESNLVPCVFPTWDSPVGRSRSWKLLGLMLGSRDDLDDVRRRWSSWSLRNSVPLHHRRSRRSKERGLEHGRWIQGFGIDRVPEGELNLTLGAGHGQFRSIFWSNQEGDHRNRLRFPIAVLFDLLTCRENTHVFQNRSGNISGAALLAGSGNRSGNQDVHHRSRRNEASHPNDIIHGNRERSPSFRDRGRQTCTRLDWRQFAFQDRLIFGNRCNQGSVRAISDTREHARHRLSRWPGNRAQLGGIEPSSQLKGCSRNHDMLHLDDGRRSRNLLEFAINEGAQKKRQHNRESQSDHQPISVHDSSLLCLRLTYPIAPRGNRSRCRSWPPRQTAVSRAWDCRVRFPDEL